MCLGAFTKQPEFKCVICGKPTGNEDNICFDCELEEREEANKK